MRYKIIYFFVVVSIFGLVSCQENRWDIPVDNSDFSLDVHDVDAIFLNLSSQETEQAHLKASNDFTELYEMEMSFNLRAPVDSNFSKLIYSFYKSDYIQKIELEKEKRFKERIKYIKRIEDGFKRLKVHFPNQKYPKELLWLNNLFAGVHSSDSAVSVGLEFYLGEKNAVVQSIPTEELYAWQRKRMDSKYLERDVVESWVQAHFIKALDGTMAEHIIQAGKTIFLIHAALPNLEENRLLKYEKSELKYAQENLSLVWEYLIDQKLLFQNNPRDKSNFLNAGPFTVGLPEEAPDRLGQYLGYKMVKGYMQKNEITLQELLTTDYNKIIQTFQID